MNNQKVTLPGENHAYSNISITAIEGKNEGFVPTGFGKPSSAVPGVSSAKFAEAANTILKITTPAHAKELADGVDAMKDNWDGKLPSYLIQTAYKDATGQQLAHRDYTRFSNFAECLLDHLHKPDTSDLKEWMANEQGWNRLPERATKRLLLMSPNLWETVGRALGDSNISVKHYVLDDNEETNYRVACAELAFNYPERFQISLRADVDSWYQLMVPPDKDPIDGLYSMLGSILRNGKFRIYDRTQTMTTAMINGMSDSYVNQMYVQNINKVSVKRIRFV